MFSRALLLASALTVLPSVAGAQISSPPSGSSERIAPAGAGVFADATASSPAGLHGGPPPPAQTQRRDSLLNGTLIGAGLGAIVGAMIGSAVLECSECAGFNVPLTFGVVGAGAGAGIGAGVDAMLHQRSSMPHVPGRARRLNVAPLIGKDVKAFVAWIRF